MKKLFLLIIVLFAFTFTSCMDETVNSSCGFYKGKPVSEGPKGGCYYINSNGNKSYVDRSYCDCM